MQKEISSVGIEWKIVYVNGFLKINEMQMKRFIGCKWWFVKQFLVVEKSWVMTRAEYFNWNKTNV